MPNLYDIPIIRAEDTENFRTITLYKYVTPIALQGLLEHGDLKITFRDDANDPYEMLTSGELPQSFGKKDAGFVSLSECGNTPAMWGNYASKYTGACLEFEIPYITKGLNGNNAIKTVYELLKKEGIISFHFRMRAAGAGTISLNDDTIIKCMYSEIRPAPQKSDDIDEISKLVSVYRANATKHRDWSYEKEYRLMVSRESSTRVSLGPPTMYFTDSISKYVKRIHLSPYSVINLKSLHHYKRTNPNNHLLQNIEVVQRTFSRTRYDLE